MTVHLGLLALMVAIAAGALHRLRKHHRSSAAFLLDPRRRGDRVRGGTLGARGQSRLSLGVARGRRARRAGGAHRRFPPREGHDGGSRDPCRGGRPGYAGPPFFRRSAFAHRAASGVARSSRAIPPDGRRRRDGVRRVRRAPRVVRLVTDRDHVAQPRAEPRLRCRADSRRQHLHAARGNASDP